VSPYKIKPTDGERHLDQSLVRSKKEASSIRSGEHEYRAFNEDEGSLLDPEMES